MGLFGGGYQKAGKGVKKNDKQLRPFFNFFTVYGRKATKLIGLNMVYFILFLPLLMFYLYYILAIVRHFFPAFDPAQLSSGFIQLLFSFMEAFPEWARILFVALSVIISGPAAAGMTYVVRHYTTETPGVNISDFFEVALKNFWQGMFFGVLDFAITSALLFIFTFNITNDFKLAQYVFILRIVLVIVYIYYSIMRFYIYPMMTTVKLKISQIIKNSSLFIVIGFWRNILAGLIMLALIWSTLNIDFIVYPLLIFSTAWFIALYITYPLLDKHMIAPLKPQKEEIDDEPIFQD